MGAFITRRLLQMLFVLFVISLFTFVVMLAFAGGPFYK